jgi:UbiD family decarboxylase
MTRLPPPAPLLDLRALLGRLGAERELVTVEAEVDPDLEIAEVHRRVIAAGGPALLFRRVRGSPFPLVTNLFGTRRRVELAFGPRPQALLERIAALPHELLPPSPARAWRHREVLAAVLRSGTRLDRRGPVTAIVDRPPGLRRLPLLRTWPEDGGAFLTLPLVLTAHPQQPATNLGIYRVQRFDDARVGLHMQIGKGGGFHLHEHERRGLPMPVNIHVGGPPAAILAALAPLPENVPELLLLSLLIGRRSRLARNPAGPLPVLADSEVVLVGRVAPCARHPEGPFGDHYGSYSLQHDYPLVEVDALLRRPDPILPATVVGKPRQEDFFLGDYLQELLAPFLTLAMPGVRRLWSYGETGYHSLAAAVVAERFGREALVSAFRILGEGQLALTKFLLVTDRDVELRDFRATLQHLLARTRVERDLYVFGNTSMDTLDYTGPRVNEGSKGVWLGTGEPVRELPAEFAGPLPAGFTAAAPFCPGCVVVSGPTFAAEPTAAARLAHATALDRWPLAVLVDDAARVARSPITFLWTTFTRFEPAADLHARAVELVRLQPSFTPPIVIDARVKPGYPKELFADAATAARVTARWREYFPHGVTMGDSDRAHLG